MNQLETILLALDLVLENVIWEGKKPSEIFRILLFAYERKWLYVSMSEGKAQAVMCAYRIPEVNEESLIKMPLKEEGTILYVPFVASNINESIYSIVREALSKYLNDNPDITEIVLEDKNHAIKRYKLKGDDDGEKSEAGVASTANISTES